MGLPLEVIKVNLRTKTLPDGSSFTAIAPKGQVPALKLDSGEVLTEGAVIVQYLASLAPEKGLVPHGNGIEKYRALEWLNFVATELHKSFSPLFDPTMPEEAKAIFRKKLESKFTSLESVLTKSSYLAGECFTVADAYLFTVSGWCGMVKVALPEFINAYRERIAARPAVQAAVNDEAFKSEK